MSNNPYTIGLDKNAANYQPLTPIGLLERAAKVYPNHTAIIHGSQHTSYGAYMRTSPSIPAGASLYLYLSRRLRLQGASGHRSHSEWPAAYRL